MDSSLTQGLVIKPVELQDLFPMDKFVLLVIQHVSHVGSTSIIALCAIHQQITNIFSTILA